jgi:hypothetical protein
MKPVDALPLSLNGESDTGDDDDEGTPEYIRRRHFPDAPADDPNLAWMKPAASSRALDASALRFDLSGTPIAPSISSVLPTHLGLHHHAEGTHAGYTLEDILLLSRSSVPAQRATMLGVLARIARRLASLVRGEVVDGLGQLRGTEEGLRKRFLAAGVEAMSERGSLGVRAVELLWECIVGWDQDMADVDLFELAEDPDTSAISTLPLDYVLPQTALAINSSSLPRESLTQLMWIVHRLAKHSNTMASSIASTPDLVSAIIRAFLLTPIPTSEASILPDPYALYFLTTLARSSRGNASALLQPADAFLRFVTMLPPHSPYPSSLATALLVSTLQLYQAFASYGLYSHIAATASSQFSLLHEHVQSAECTSAKLASTWIELLEAWIVCATNPHRTSPSHDIVWSQVVGCGWGEGVLEMSKNLGVTEAEWGVWSAIWNAGAAWLEGSRIDGVRGGEGERRRALEFVKRGFEGGNEISVLSNSTVKFRHGLDQLRAESNLIGLDKTLRDVGIHAKVVSSAMRLWLACLPPISDGPLVSPPFSLPFDELSQMCASVVTHPIWSSVATSVRLQARWRPFSSLISAYLRLSRRHPNTSEDLWLAQALAIASRLVPGDEEFGRQVIEEILQGLKPTWSSLRAQDVPPAIEGRRGLDLLKPFLVENVRQEEDIYVAPTLPTPHSLPLATTQRLPRVPANACAAMPTRLPLSREWTFSGLNHILHSGTSKVLEAASLPSWEASETDVVRATLFLVKVTREVLCRHDLRGFAPTRSETVFGCMKVFMLEHVQPNEDSSEDVFRDAIVCQAMTDLLAPWTVPAPMTTNIPAETDDLEKAAIPFLGPSTPFFQYYTDFVALYDAISFAHPLFASLLLPPTSMRYPIDYRKHLWNDYGNILGTIRTPVEQVIAGSVAEYLWPVANDPTMIGAYLRALLNQPLPGFVRFVAVHHVACNIWPDLRREEQLGDDRASKLLKVVVDQGDFEVVKEVALYRQSDELVAVPPECFEQDGPWKSSRLDALKSWNNSVAVGRLVGLLRSA